MEENLFIELSIDVNITNQSDGINLINHDGRNDNMILRVLNQKKQVGLNVVINHQL